MDMETYFTGGDLPGEIWKPVVLPERYKSTVSAYYVSKSYMVSNMGRVKSTTRKVFVTNGNRKKKIWEYPWYTHLGQLITPYMMYHVWLYSPGDRTTYVPIPVLVASAFIPNPNNYKYVLPKDEDRSNCCDSNLYWSNSRYTESEKKKHRQDMNRLEVKAKISGAMKGKGVKAVYCVTNDTVYASLLEAGEKLNIPGGRGTVSRACQGKYRSGNGHVYKKLGLEFWYLSEYEEKFGKVAM